MKTEPVFCADCGRRLRERRSFVSDYIFLTCPKHWTESFWTYLRGNRGHTDIITDRKVAAVFDPQTGERR